jgi:hypothetical protein
LTLSAQVAILNGVMGSESTAQFFNLEDAIGSYGTDLSPTVPAMLAAGDVACDTHVSLLL